MQYGRLDLMLGDLMLGPKSDRLPGRQKTPAKSLVISPAGEHPEGHKGYEVSLARR
jgi:hypothetical protein